MDTNILKEKSVSNKRKSDTRERAWLGNYITVSNPVYFCLYSWELQQAMPQNENKTEIKFSILVNSGHNETSI